jgi:hypothetical protein
MAFQSMIAAQGKWRKRNGRNRLPEIIHPYSPSKSLILLS